MRIASLGLALAALLAASAAAVGFEPPGGRPSVSLGMLVRLHDLPPGYVVVDDTEDVACFRLDLEGAEPPLAEYLSRYFPAECEAGYDRLYAVAGHGPDPRSVASLVIDPGGAAGMRAAETVLPELVGRTLTGNVAPTEVPTPNSLGTETWLFHTSHANVLGKSARGSLLVWRQEELLGATLVAGAGGTERNDRLALRFARLQAGRMRDPVPYPPKARDDTLVPLDNPALKLPTYWLGRRFALGDGDELELESAYGPLREGEAPPGTRIELHYAGGVRIGTWTQATWKTYSASKLGRELLTWNCTRTTSFPVAGGEATIYRGYPKDYSSCPAKAPNLAAAVVDTGGVVLGLNLPLCYGCLEPGGPTGTQLETAVRGLRLRPQRDLSASR